MPTLLCPPSAERPEWLAARRQGIGASEISAVCGISPWDSPFSLWYRKLHGWEIADTPEMEAGRRAEPMIADWFADQHPELKVTECGLFANDERPWQIATPDRRLWTERLEHPYGDPTYVPHVVTEEVGVVECKLAHDWDGWGEPGTDEIPVYFETQVQWQMDVMGCDIAHVAAFSHMHFREYVVRRSERTLRMMRERGERFWQSLQDGEPPELDDHPATLSIIRQINPDIVDRKQEVPAPIVANWLRAKQYVKKAKRLESKYAAQMRAHMGDAQHAICRGSVVASRSRDDKLMPKEARK